METPMANEQPEFPPPDSAEIPKLARLVDVTIGLACEKRETITAGELRGAVLLGEDEGQLAIAIQFEVVSHDKQPVHVAILPADACRLISCLARAMRDVLEELTAGGAGEEADDADGR
jgi:hypothetical protein